MRRHQLIFYWIVTKKFFASSYAFYDALSINYLSCHVEGLKLLYVSFVWDLIYHINSPYFYLLNLPKKTSPVEIASLRTLHKTYLEKQLHKINHPTPCSLESDR